VGSARRKETLEAMSGLCGWIDIPATDEERQRTIVAMAAGLPAPLGGCAAPCHATAGAAALAVHTEPLPGRLHTEGQRLIAICGRPEWSDPQLAAASEEQGPARVLAREYGRRREQVLQGLHGAFALAVVDSGRRELFLAIDRLGICTLTFAAAAGGLLFASDSDALLRHPAASRGLDPQALFDYVYFHMLPGPAGIYRGHERLLPGQFLRFQSGAIERGTYWHMRYRPERRPHYPDFRDEFLAHLEAAVAGAAAGASAGAFLSGGTDSSTVAGMLARSASDKARTFSIGFDAEGYDETGYARIAARHFGTEHHEYYVSPQDVVDSIPLIAAAYDLPYGNASALPTYHCARLAREHGITRLLGGDGGDELFGGNSRYAKQNVFSYYERIPASVRRGILEPLLARGADRARGPMRKLRRYVAQAAIPLPDRAETYNLLHHFGIDRVFAAEFLESVNPGHPLEVLRDTYGRADADGVIDRLLALDLKQTLADNDLPKVTRMCDLAGVEPAFPLLDHRLVEFSGRLPPSWKVRGTRLRVFFKKALADFLPGEILTKPKHGFGLPFGVWMNEYQPLRELAGDALGRLHSQGIFRRDFLDALIDRHLDEHAAYYGTMVWVLMMLSQWLDARSAHTAATAPTPASGAPMQLR